LVERLPHTLDRLDTLAQDPTCVNLLEGSHMSTVTIAGLIRTKKNEKRKQSHKKR
jgi:hypothetical protein